MNSKFSVSSVQQVNDGCCGVAYSSQLQRPGATGAAAFVAVALASVTSRTLKIRRSTTAVGVSSALLFGSLSILTWTDGKWWWWWCRWCCSSEIVLPLMAFASLWAWSQLAYEQPRCICKHLSQPSIVWSIATTVSYDGGGPWREMGSDGVSEIGCCCWCCCSWYWSMDAAMARDSGDKS